MYITIRRMWYVERRIEKMRTTPYLRLYPALWHRTPYNSPKETKARLRNSETQGAIHSWNWRQVRYALPPPRHNQNIQTVNDFQANLRLNSCFDWFIPWLCPRNCALRGYKGSQVLRWSTGDRWHTFVACLFPFVLLCSLDYTESFVNLPWSPRISLPTTTHLPSNTFMRSHQIWVHELTRADWHKRNSQSV